MGGCLFTKEAVIMSNPDFPRAYDPAGLVLAMLSGIS